MADLCMCGHEEREHVHPDWADSVSCAGECMCDGFVRSPLSAFRGPRVTFTREEAAGWLYALVGNVDGLHSNTHAMVRLLARDARANLDIGDHESAAACYLAARILRAVRP